MHRHVYQSSRGGKGFVPADHHFGLVGKCSPRLANLLSSDYTSLSAAEVSKYHRRHHMHEVSTDLIERITARVCKHLAATEFDICYDLPEEVDVQQVHSVAVSRDGAYALMRDGGKSGQAAWRESMCGTVSLYDKEAKLLHTIYMGVGPQYGKAAFGLVQAREVRQLSHQLSAAGVRPIWVGVADGAQDNWPALESMTRYQITDYYHVLERVNSLAECLYPKPCVHRTHWIGQAKEWLLEWPAGVQMLLEEVERRMPEVKTKKRQQTARAALTYLKNQSARMNYYIHRKKKLPIGSGIVEAACKTLVKSRLCATGMYWNIENADSMLQLRSLTRTPGRSEQYWQDRMRRAA